MKLDALDHPKTLDFAARLGVSRPTAIGHLELLWAFVGKLAPQGNVGKFADGAIARASEWQGNPAEFIAALVAAGFLDEDPGHRLLIHDWHQHCPRWVSAKLKKLGITFSEPTVVATPVPTAVATTEPSPCARASPGEGKAGEGKCVRTHAQEPTAERTPEGNRELQPRRVNGAQQTAEAKSDETEHAEWETVAALYPPGAARADWIGAEKAARELVLGGHAAWTDLRAGVTRYAKHCAATNRMVTNPVRFFTDRDKPWSQAWPLPAGAARAEPWREEFMRRTDPKTGIEP